MTRIQQQLIDVEVDALLTLIAREAERLVDVSDAIHFDHELEELLPQVALIILHYTDEREGQTPQRALLQITDTLARWIADPSLLPEGVIR